MLVLSVILILILTWHPRALRTQCSKHPLGHPYRVQTSAWTNGYSPPPALSKNWKVVSPQYGFVRALPAHAATAHRESRRTRQHCSMTAPRIRRKPGNLRQHAIFVLQRAPPPQMNNNNR